MAGYSYLVGAPLSGHLLRFLLIVPGIISLECASPISIRPNSARRQFGDRVFLRRVNSARAAIKNPGSEGGGRDVFARER